MDDVTEAFKDKDGCDEVGHFELFKCLNARRHEFLSFFLCTRSEVLQHLEEKLLALINALGTLDY